MTYSLFDEVTVVDGKFFDKMGKHRLTFRYSPMNERIVYLCKTVRNQVEMQYPVLCIYISKRDDLESNMVPVVVAQVPSIKKFFIDRQESPVFGDTFGVITEHIEIALQLRFGTIASDVCNLPGELAYYIDKIIEQWPLHRYLKDAARLFHHTFRVTKFSMIPVSIATGYAREVLSLSLSLYFIS